MKKKVLNIILILAVLASLTACGDNKGTDGGSANTANNQSDSSDKSSKAGPSVSKDGKVLVAYFAVAEMIQEKTGGDLFSIKTSVKYPGDGEKLVEFAQKEQDDDARPELTSHIDNLDDYSVIFVGFPKMEYQNHCV